jgi:hypothetical protein
VCWPATVVEAASPVDIDAGAVALGFVVPGGAGLDVGALPDGEETGAGPPGDDDVGVVDVGVVDVGVVDVWVGSVEDATAVGLRLVVPGLAGPDVGALPDGEEMGAGPPGDDVGVVEVCVGFVGEGADVGDRVGGAEVGCCGDAGVGVGMGGCAGAVTGTTSKRNAFPLLSTATQGEPETHETAFKLPKRSSSVGVDHAEPS